MMEADSTLEVLKPVTEKRHLFPTLPLHLLLPLTYHCTLAEPA